MDEFITYLRQPHLFKTYYSALVQNNYCNLSMRASLGALVLTSKFTAKQAANAPFLSVDSAIKI